MARIDNRDGEITLIYNSEQLDDRQAFSYLKSIASERLHTIDLTKEKLDESQITDLAEEMDIKIESLVDKNNRLLFHEIENGNLTRESLIKLLSLRPDFMRTPITIWNGKTEYWDSAYEMIKYDTSLNKSNY